MMAENRRVFREGRVSAEEVERLNDVRRKVLEEFPPDPNRPRPAENGIGAQVRVAREAKGLSWYALAELTGTTDAETIRDIEYVSQAQRVFDTNAPTQAPNAHWATRLGVRVVRPLNQRL